MKKITPRRAYYLPCVCCPFCKEVVEAKVTEMNGLKTISCPACGAEAVSKLEKSL